jgi:uncharacterized protein
MATQIFVNLPVKHLRNSIGFFEKLGFAFNPQFYVMLLTREKFQTFTPRQICDASKSTEVLVCLTCDTRQKVDEMVKAAIGAGGSTYNRPQDHGFMYQHGFQDLDGHIWELVYMWGEPVEPAEPRST